KGDGIIGKFMKQMQAAADMQEQIKRQKKEDDDENGPAGVRVRKPRKK
ncbi:MAG: hypothetical protein ACI92S_005404, partial [Planctomycetaceae bacterium]